MTIVDLTPRDLRVTVSRPNGSNPLDVSELVESFVVGNSQEDRSGLVKASGTLVLAANPLAEFAESLNPRLNQTRWARRCRVAVEVWHDGGWVAHPRGRLRILQIPKVPFGRASKLELSVGCLLTLQDYRQPPGEDSEIEPGSPQPRGVVISRLATKAGIPNLIDPIAAEINFPIARLSGSYVKQMGELAYAVGYHLWIDNQERLRATRLDLGRSADFAMVLGVDEASYEPLEPDETPVEVVRTTTICPRAKPVLDPEPTWTITRNEEWDPFEISYSGSKDLATSSPVNFGRSRQPNGVVYPNRIGLNRTALTTAREQYNYRYFDLNGFLKREVNEVRAPKATIYERLLDYNEIIPVERTETYYTYKDRALTTQIETFFYEPAIRIDPENPDYYAGFADPYELKLASYEAQRWDKVNRKWRKTNVNQDFRSDGSSSATTTIGGNGDNQPPAPELRDEPYYLEEVALEAEAKFPAIPGLAFDERDRNFDVPTATSEEDLRRIARQIGRLLHGRNYGISWAMDLRDGWLTDYQPFQVLEVVEGNNRSRYLIDGDSFSWERRRCAVGGDGIYLGEVQIYTPPATPANPNPEPIEAIIPPYQEADQLQGKLVLGGHLKSYPYPIVSASDGFGVQGRLTLSGYVGQVNGVQGRLEVSGYLSDQDTDDGTSLEDLIALGLQGSAGMDLLISELVDDDYIQIADIGFDFPFYDGFYRTDIFVGSNSYLTFGFGSDNYSGLDEFNPGRALHIQSDDRSYNFVYGVAASNHYRIRFEGNQGRSGLGNSQVWEVTLFNDGVILVMVGAIASDGVSMATNGNWEEPAEVRFTTFAPTPNSYWVLQPDGDSYTVESGTHAGEVAATVEDMIALGLQGPAGMTVLDPNPSDDTAVGLADIGFDFPLYDGTYRDDIYVVANSYITFGFNSDEFEFLSETNPGRALHVRSDDRSRNAVYAAAGVNYCRIRFEGNLGRSGPGTEQIWEVVLFENGVILVLIGGAIASDGTSLLTDGSGANFTPFAPTINTYWVFEPDGNGSYTLDSGPLQGD